MTRLPILLLAAGASRRMRGADKLMQEVAGRALIVERAEAARATGERVFVALPPRGVAPARWQALDASGAALVEVMDADSGMAASLREGLAALPGDARGVLIVLADMPEITSGDMLSLISRAGDGDSAPILRGATNDGAPGHPVLFPARDFAGLARLGGDHGAREMLVQQHDRVRLVPLPGHHAVTDLDTPEDWARWRGGVP